MVMEIIWGRYGDGDDSVGGEDHTDDEHHENDIDVYDEDDHSEEDDDTVNMMSIMSRTSIKATLASWSSSCFFSGLNESSFQRRDF